MVGVAHGNNQTELMLSLNVLALKQNPYRYGESAFVSFGVFLLSIVTLETVCVSHKKKKKGIQKQDGMDEASSEQPVSDFLLRHACIHRKSTLYRQIKSG